MFQRFLNFCLTFLILIHVAAASYAAFWSWQEVYEPRQVPESQRLFRVPAGATLNQVLTDLSDRNLAPPPLIVRSVLALRDRSVLVKKGTYLLPEQTSTWHLLELLDEGQVRLSRLTVPEGLDKWEIATLLGATSWGDEATFTALLNDPQPIADLDPEAQDLEGYLFPETYYFEETATPSDIVTALIQEFRNQTETFRQTIAQRGGNLREWLTLASLVEEESAVAEERATIAGVFSKRLERGMLLQCDPTIVYSLKLNARYRGKIYRSDIGFEHPYNTYTTPGLPPGPICNPGRAAMAAALNPADTPYLYFVARNNGTHHFSKTLREHNRAVAKYQR